MTEFFDINTGAFRADKLTKWQRVLTYVRNNYPNLPYSFSSDGMITIGDENFTLTPEQKQAIEAQIAAL